jgi:hypothetical protein
LTIVIQFASLARATILTVWTLVFWVNPAL